VARAKRTNGLTTGKSGIQIRTASVTQMAFRPDTFPSRVLK